MSVQLGIAKLCQGPMEETRRQREPAGSGQSRRCSLAGAREHKV